MQVTRLSLGVGIVGAGQGQQGQHPRGAARRAALQGFRGGRLPLAGVQARLGVGQHGQQVRVRALPGDLGDLQALGEGPQGRVRVRLLPLGEEGHGGDQGGAVALLAGQGSRGLGLLSCAGVTVQRGGAGAQERHAGAVRLG